MRFQRVYLPMRFPDCPADLRLYGIVRMVDGAPEHTRCCSLTPSVWVEGLGWDTADEDVAGEPCEGGYFDVGAVLAGLDPRVIECEDENEARERAAGNW